MPLMIFEVPPIPLMTASSLLSAMFIGCPWRGVGTFPNPTGSPDAIDLAGMAGTCFVPECPLDTATCAPLHGPAFP